MDFLKSKDDEEKNSLKAERLYSNDTNIIQWIIQQSANKI